MWESLREAAASVTVSFVETAFFSVTLNRRLPESVEVKR